MNDYPEDQPPIDGQQSAVVEVLDPGFDVPRGPAVRLTGDAARNFAETLGTLAVAALDAHARSKALFRVAPSPEVAKKLAKGTLYWATPSAGDASVLIKNSETGRIAAHGRLVGPSVTKVLGPAAWQVLAVATQQHYLVSIDKKLAAVKSGVEELLAQNSDARLGTLDHAARRAAVVLDATDEGRRVSPTAVQELANVTHRADETFHQLLRQAQRRASRFANDEGDPGDVEATWTELLYALQVLIRCSLAQASLPYADAQDLAALEAEELSRTRYAIQSMRDLALELSLGSLEADIARTRWETDGFKPMDFTRDAALEAADLLLPFPSSVKDRWQKDSIKGHWARRAVKERRLLPLGADETQSMSELLAPNFEVPRLFVTVNVDGSVLVAPRSAASSLGLSGA